jgi:hypothetical protein
VSDLHENLNSAFTAVDPGAAPVEAAMLAGRKIRNRRRTWAVVGSAAAIAVVAVCYPALARQQALPAPVTGKVRVTVNPPGPHSPAGLIASGKIGTGTWQLLTDKPGSGEVCFYAGGTLASQFAAYACGGSAVPDESGSDPSGPVAFQGAGGKDSVLWGQVDPAVSHVTVELADGTVLTLHPATVYGVRYVAFAVPADMVVDRATAYSRTGEIATAIPYRAPDGLPTFQAWLRPGQAVPERISGAFGSGTVDGHPWRATAYLGPWGTCLQVGDGDSYCFDPSQQPATGAESYSPSWVMGTAADSASYLVITLKNGRTMRVGVTAVGPQKFWGVGLGEKAQTGARWTAYNAEGKRVASGSL